MRQHLRPSLSVLSLLLALLVPSLLVIESAHSKSAAASDRVSSDDTRQRPSGDGGDAGARTDAASSSLSKSEGAAATRVRQNYGLLPLSFEANRGQADARVRFLARNSAYSVYLTADEIALALRDASEQTGARRPDERAAPREGRASVVRIKLLGASKQPRAFGLDELEGKSNYLVGRDPARWRTNVPNYGKVKYEGVYPGVDVIYYGTLRQLEYDFVVAPGADAGLIRMRIEGAKGIRIDADGDLVLPTAAGELRQRAPHAYQESEGGRQTISCRYVLRGAGRVGFELGEYDRSKPLVIDPVLAYSTYLGGSGYDEGSAIAVDAQGNAYVTGYTTSWDDFPVTPNALQTRRGGGAPHQMTYDAFVTKLNADGTALVYSTYLGGFRDDFSTSIAVDDAGHAHVVGWTESTDFPTTPGAHRTTSAGDQDIFVTKLDADGSSLAYSTYLGGTGHDYGAHVALGSGGEIYVGGQTPSTDFPVTPGSLRTQMTSADPYAQDGFVTKLSPVPGAGLIFSTYLGGSNYDAVEGIAVAAGLDDSVYVTGRTFSTDFPTTPNALQTAGGGSNYDAFVTRLNSAGSEAIYSTYLGGSDYDGGSAVKVDGGGAAYVAGFTYSQNFPATPGVYQSSNGGGGDAFVAKLNADGTSLHYATFFGGATQDRACALAVDEQGNAYVAGDTESYGLPVTPGAPGPSHGGGFMDGLFFKLNSTGGLSHATYLGGSEWDSARGVAVGASGNDVYVTGVTSSPNFLSTPGAFQPQDPDEGRTDAFVIRIVLEAGPYTVSGRVTNSYGSGLRDAEVTVYEPFYQTVQTDADGYYTISGLPPGAWVRLYANRYGFFFFPVEAVLPNISRNETVDFSGHGPLIISGRILNELGYPVMASVTLSGTVSDVTYTNYDGFYSFTVPEGGSYTVTPYPDPVFTYSPPSRSVSNLTGDQTFDFTAQREPRIEGRVILHEYNYGLNDIRVTLTGPSLPEPVVRTTDPWGYFSFDQLERGASYTVTPTDPVTNRSFTPAEQTIAELQGQPFLTFNALPPLAIHGRVTDPSGNPITGVATLTGSANAETQVDQWGHFDFFNLPRGGDYTVTITKPGTLYTFAPPSRSVTNLQELQALDFTALPPLRIMGRVAEANNNAVRATVTLSGTVNAETQADEYGIYQFTELPRGGDYTVTVAYPLYTFAPPTRSVSDIQDHQFFDFEALPPLRINGGVADENGVGLPGATVTLTGTVNATTSTGENGLYSFNDLPRGGTYVVTPAHELYTYTPPSREFPALSDNQVVGFDGALRRFSLTGRVVKETGAPLSGVIMTLGGSGAATTQTDANGNYSFANLVVTRAYTVAAARPGYSFAPATVNINDPRGDQTANFTGSHLTYTIGGRVTDNANGAGVEGATITLSGGRSATTQTDAEGNYSFAGLPSEGDYTIHVSHQHLTFGFPTFTYFNVLSDLPSVNFSGWRNSHRLAGRVTDTAGNALNGVTVTLGGAHSLTAQTNSVGEYFFPPLPAGLDYTVTATKAHYIFNPPIRQLDDLGGDTTADFNATLLRHNISGRVVDSGGNGFAGVTVQLTGTVNRVATTDATGNYSFTLLPGGGYFTVEPSRQFYDFSPVRGIVNDLGGDQTANFTATLRTYSVGGRVTEGTNGVAGVTVNLGGSRTATTQTDAAGNYLFTALPANGAYTVTPAHPFFTFAPGSTPFNTLPSNQTANFAATRLLYQVSGYTRDLCGLPISGITMSLTHDGVTVTAQSNASGFYSFNGVQAGYNYTLAPSPSVYTHAPTSHLFPALNANQVGNYSMRPPASTADVLPVADLYVRGGTSAGTNFGTATQLITRLSQTNNTYETYVRFDLGQRCMASAVKLRLYGELSSSGTLPVGVYAVSSTTWTETGTTWNNKPAAGTLIRTVSMSGTTAKWYEWDVTDYVRSELAMGRSTVSFVLKSTSQTNYQATFNSRQATGTNAPRLAVTTP